MGTKKQTLVFLHPLPNLTNSPFPPNDILVRTRLSRPSYEVARNHLSNLSLDVFLPQNRSSTNPLTLSNSKNQSLSTLTIFINKHMRRIKGKKEKFLQSVAAVVVKDVKKLASR